ncbi:MAG: hypothetical protein J6Y84_04875 [Bacteroidaceae bacterium]|nr:hypothetical protein [Bacteroidaceae bacterium]
MKKSFFTLLLLSFLATAANAQILVGDMNGDGNLDVSDVTSIVSIILGNSSKQYIYGDNMFVDSLIVENHTYVNLGLPSGTLWATCNVGAESPEDNGDYFAWGETEGYNEGKTDFSWSTYKWCNGSISTITKYCNNSSYGNNGFRDILTELELSDDAAYVKWGPAWRMPSKEQFDELINSEYTTTEWTTQNGVNGRKITSKSNGNSLFLPVAGYRGGSSLNYAGSYGYYWSRTLNPGNPYYAWHLSFDPSFVGTSNGGRCSGRSVRPVRLSE